MWEIPTPNYVGIFLDLESQAKLFEHATLTDKNPLKCAHHVTVVSPKQINRYEEFMGKLGDEFTLSIKEIIKGKIGDKGYIEAAFVTRIIPQKKAQASKELPHYNENEAHITLSRQHDKVPPYLAGALKKSPNTTTKPVALTLKGKLGFFYRVGEATKIAYSIEDCKSVAGQLI